MKRKSGSIDVSSTGTHRAVGDTLVVRPVDGPTPYLELLIRESVTEASMEPLFACIVPAILRHRPSRVLVDMREASVDLTISDLNELAKLVAANLAGVLEKLVLVLRPKDILPDKFFEPSVNNRGLPTLVTNDIDEAIYWLGAKGKLHR